MRTGMRVAALFAAYGMIGFGGDSAAALLAEAVGDDVAFVTTEARWDEAAVSVRRDVVVDVRPEVRVGVRVRAGSACTYSDERTQRVALDGARELSLHAGSGFLRIEGRSDLDDIVIESVACASEEAWLDALSLDVTRGSDQVRVQAMYPDRRDTRRGDNTASLDLTILVPAGLAVSIDDSSGDIEVTETGSLRVADSSGSIRIGRIDGSVVVDDSSGDIDIEDVQGDVDLEDGSGGIRIRDVRGSVALRDGSGGIEVDGVERDLLIESDGSGGIDVRSVGGDFVVGRDGSGSIRHSDVAGRVDVPQKKRRRRG